MYAVHHPQHRFPSRAKESCCGERCVQTDRKVSLLVLIKLGRLGLSSNTLVQPREPLYRCPCDEEDIVNVVLPLVEMRRERPA